MVIWCEIQVLEGVMEFFWVSGKGSWNVRENGFRKSVATLISVPTKKTASHMGAPPPFTNKLRPPHNERGPPILWGAGIQNTLSKALD